MSGRAGRRGLDDKGIVMLMVDQKMSPGACKNIVKVSLINCFVSVHIKVYVEKDRQVLNFRKQSLTFCSEGPS